MWSAGTLHFLFLSCLFLVSFLCISLVEQFELGVIGIVTTASQQQHKACQIETTEDAVSETIDAVEVLLGIKLNFLSFFDLNFSPKTLLLKGVVV